MQNFNNFSGGILCDATVKTCGHPSSTNAGGAIVREGTTFVLTHGVTSDGASGSLGFKLNYAQIPCSGVAGLAYDTP